MALVTRTEADLLQAYAEAGGGIVFAPGDRVKPANYNAVLYRDGKGVLPALLEGPVGNAARSRTRRLRVRRVRSEPSDRRSVSRKSGSGVDPVVTLEYIQAKLAPGSPSRGLKFSSGDPAIIERPVGRGRSVL